MASFPSTMETSPFDQGAAWGQGDHSVQSQGIGAKEDQEIGEDIGVQTRIHYKAKEPVIVAVIAVPWLVVSELPVLLRHVVAIGDVVPFAGRNNWI